MHLVVFEDDRWGEFAPLSLSRPVFTLLSGCTSLLQKQIQHLGPKRVTLWVRPEMAPFCRLHVAPTLGVSVAVNAPLDDEPALLSDGRLFREEKASISNDLYATVDDDNRTVEARVKSPGLSARDCLTSSKPWQALANLPRGKSSGKLMRFPWDLIHHNEQAIVADSEQWRIGNRTLPTGPYHVVNEQNVLAHSEAVINPGAVLDGSKGPIVIEAGASIGANCVIKGPCFIGRGSAITPLAYIREGASIGPMCKVGGEVSNAIVLGHSNKVHDGYLGHSYLGEWVNLGAGTTTSNLKNTYGTIKMRIGSREISSGRQFLGSLIGDHTKTAIGTRLMSGTYLGYCCLLASGALPPKFIASFTYWTDKGTEAYLPDKAQQVMAQVYSRRNRPWIPDGQAMLEYVDKAREMAEK